MLFRKNEITCVYTKKPSFFKLHITHLTVANVALSEFKKSSVSYCGIVILEFQTASSINLSKRDINFTILVIHKNNYRVEYYH